MRRDGWLREEKKRARCQHQTDDASAHFINGESLFRSDEQTWSTRARISTGQVYTDRRNEWLMVNACSNNWLREGERTIMSSHTTDFLPSRTVSHWWNARERSVTCLSSCRVQRNVNHLNNDDKKNDWSVVVVIVEEMLFPRWPFLQSAMIIHLM